MWISRWFFLLPHRFMFWKLLRSEMALSWEARTRVRQGWGFSSWMSQQPPLSERGPLRPRWGSIAQLTELVLESLWGSGHGPFLIHPLFIICSRDLWEKSKWRKNGSFPRRAHSPTVEADTTAEHGGTKCMKGKGLGRKMGPNAAWGWGAVRVRVFVSCSRRAQHSCSVKRQIGYHLGLEGPTVAVTTLSPPR